jgi:predicted MFS family arabinose efflux permease
MSEQAKAGCPRTRLAFLMMNLTNEPLAALYSLLPFILRKDLGATTYQITLFITLRPLLSVFAFYWGAFLSRRKLLPNLIGAWVLGRLPFLFFPLLDQFWYLLCACGMYQLFSRAATPALIEIVKRNMPKEPRERMFSLYYLLTFMESAGLGVWCGHVLDRGAVSWKLLCALSALAGLASVWFQRRIHIAYEEECEAVLRTCNPIVQPLKESFRLLRVRPDFARFQWGFMCGGMALMMLAPALSVYYVDVLHLSHLDMTTARLVFMGVGVLCSSLLWKKGLGQVTIFRLMAYVLLGFGLFPLLLFAAPQHTSVLYLAFFIYGVAQTGSHLIWNLSGTLFARSEDSSAPFTTVNVLMIGLRGAVGPLLGGVLCEHLGPVPVMWIGTALVGVGCLSVLRKGAQESGAAGTG